MKTDIFDDIMKEHFSLYGTVYMSDMLAACEAAYKLALKSNKAPVAEVPCSDGLCAELSLMLDVFNSCIETKTLPKAGSPCQEKIIELLKRCGKEPTALKVRGA